MAEGCPGACTLRLQGQGQLGKPARMELKMQAESAKPQPTEVHAIDEQMQRLMKATQEQKQRDSDTKRIHDKEERVRRDSADSEASEDLNKFVENSLGELTIA